MSFSEFINMGGYGFYIWTSYAITTIIFVSLLVTFKIQRNQLVKQLRKTYRHTKRQTERQKST